MLITLYVSWTGLSLCFLFYHPEGKQQHSFTNVLYMPTLKIMSLYILPQADLKWLIKGQVAELNVICMSNHMFHQLVTDKMKCNHGIIAQAVTFQCTFIILKQSLQTNYVHMQVKMLLDFMQTFFIRSLWAICMNWQQDNTLIFSYFKEITTDTFKFKACYSLIW